MITTFSTAMSLFSSSGGPAFLARLPGYTLHCWTILIVGSSPNGSMSGVRGIAMPLTDLREILRYVPRFRDKLFVIALDGAVVESDNFRNLLLDIALLRSLRIGVALLHGAAHQIRRLAEETNVTPSNLDGG